MKVSINLAQAYSNVDLKSISKEELLTRIGAQLGAVEDAVDWSAKYEGAVIVKVIECEKHPDADKLSLCRVDDGGKNQSVERGEDGLIQVVCGAPNVRAGMYAVWLAPGVVVPNTRDTDPFTLEARAIRGQVSNGMMASASELGISEDHSGIVEVTAEDAGKQPVPGEELVNYYGLDDYVVDCENKMFTHRPDCFGNLGVARELAGISGLEFKSPQWYLSSPLLVSRDGLELNIKNEASDLVPRFMAVVYKNVKVGPSPIWLQALLTRVGIKPINNVVDTTNYVMHLTGQPLHAFDYDKIAERSDAPGIFPRMAQKGEKITLLGSKEVELSGEEIVIATDKQAVALAGVMGGADTEVSGETKNIIIECATFDMYSIRRTSMRHGLFTDAVTRYTKGQSPLQNGKVLMFILQKLAELAGGEQASLVYDIMGNAEVLEDIHVSAGFINERLGCSLSANEIRNLLARVEMNVSVEGDDLTVSVPFWRRDLEIAEDIVEEVGRLYGYDRLPVVMPKRGTKPSAKNDLVELKYQLRNQLAAAGANEVLTYSFVHGNLLRTVGVNPEENAYHLRNAISPDLQYYRTSVLPSLLTKVHPNIKAQAGDTNNQFALFEMGRAHVKGIDLDEDGLPKQLEHLAFVVAADEKTAKARQAGAPFYLARKYLDHLFGDKLRYSDIDEVADPSARVFQKGRSAAVFFGDNLIGVVGEFTPIVRKSLKLPAFAAGFEISLDRLVGANIQDGYQPLPVFPGSSSDITLEIAKDTPHYEVSTLLESRLSDLSLAAGYDWSLEPGDVFVKDGEDKKYITFSVHLNHPSKTLTTEEVTSLTEKLKNLEV